MQTFIGALTGVGGISSSSLWQNIVDIVPYLIIIFSFSFGILYFRKQLKDYGMI